ncbi:MAG: hypothetical protein IJ588_02455 [Prevotella sp.]|nr:hypothetical protein [Prevotella sp.]
MITIDERQGEMHRQLGAAASMVKVVMGVANGCALNIMLDCYTELSGKATDPRTGDRKPPHPKFRHQVKAAYKQAIEEYHHYERRLVYATVNRFFHVDDLSPKYRKIYGDITDAEFFEFWKGTSAKAYQVSRPLVTSLWNKYRLSLLNHKVPHAEQLAWACVGQAVLTLACDIFQTAIADAIQAVPMLQPHQVRGLFKDFSLSRVRDAWTRALRLTEDINYELEPTEDKNIQMGILQLAETWANPDYIYDSVSETLPEYEEIFRTKGEMKKALRNIEEVRAQTWENLEKDELVI